MARWTPGQSVIERMLADNQLQEVPASRDQADFLINEARKHATAAAAIADIDASGAYALTYDAARKALVAVLAVQGLRPTADGGHVAVIDAVSAQLGEAAGAILKPFNRMRHTRHDTEYPSGGAPTVDADDVRSDLSKAEDMIHMAEQSLGALGSWSS